MLYPTELRAHRVSAHVGSNIGRTGLEPANLPVPNRTLYQAELPPVLLALPELYRSPPAMTISAANLTFRHFLTDSFPAQSVDHVRNIVQFLASNVVKLQSYRVGLSTIHAPFCF